MIEKKQFWLFGLIALFVVLNFFVWQEVFILNAPAELRVKVLDIGQGDAIFIQTPARRTFLVDGGPSSAVLGKLSSMLPFWQRHLDAIILTHPDQDHLMGLLEVLKRYRVSYIFWTGMVRDGANYQEWLKILTQKEKEGSQIIITSAPMQIKNAGVRFEILHPIESLNGTFFGKKGNDTGIVSRLVYGKNSFLLTADISAEIEKKLLAYKAFIHSDVLKVAHHGSWHSTSLEFLQAVTPEMAVISVGKDNSYGHPAPEVLQKLVNFGIQTLRTDQVGDILFISDGNNIYVKK